LVSIRPWLRAIGFMAALSGFLTLIFVVPAAALGIANRWEVWAAAALYLVFFTQGTGLRTVRHGEFEDRKRDRQIRSTAGKIAALVTAPGLLLAHWVSLHGLSLAPQSTGSVTPTAAAGVTLALLGLGVNVHATRTLGRFFDRLTIKDGHELITRGIYGIIRHPIYTSYLCLFFSFPLLTGSLWGTLAMAGVCAIWFGSRIPAEEAMLEEAFGDEYRRYKARTRRLIPFVL
jgi:protein-S-isoprenylcysteine O-methyltransferase Ste14